MGWASYFEDDTRRREESDAFFVDGLATLGQSRAPTALELEYARLSQSLSQVRQDAADRCARDHWARLEQEMQSVHEEASSFQARMLGAGYEKVLAEADRLQHDLDLVLGKAKALAVFLDTLMAPLSRQLKYIHALNKMGHQPVSAHIRDSESECDWLLHGWRALRHEIEELEDRAAELQPNLAGEVQDCLFEGLDAFDKDAFGNGPVVRRSTGVTARKVRFTRTSRG